MRTIHQFITRKTQKNFQILDLTADLRALVKESGIGEGIATISSMHTTTAICVNENEERLLDDIEAFFLRLAPADARYLHNDIQLRDCPPDEPENAHSHLIALMLGNSESLSLAAGELVLGRYQSVMLVELDGPRERNVSVTFMGE